MMVLDEWKDRVLDHVHLFVGEVLKVLGILEKLLHPGLEEVHEGLRVHCREVVGTDHGTWIEPLRKEK